MGPKIEIDAICLLIDSVRCFSEAKDRFALVLFGSQETDNSMDYEGVKVVRDVWGPASFELLRYLELKVGGESEKGSDWLDAIVVGLDYLKDKAPQANKKIVLMSDLATPCNEDQFEVIVTNMENENAELCFFGPEWDESGTSQGPTSDLLNQMVERTDVVLEIGPNIRISTTGYIAVRREPVKSWKKCLARPTDESSYELKPEVSYVRKDDNEKTVEANNLIESYKYGSKLITVSEEDRANFHYEGGGKSLKVIGFIKKDQIPNQYLLGNGNMAFLPTENDPHSSTALSAIILSMVELGRAALVRKVYRAKTTPRMGILVPEIITPEDDEESDETYRLIFIELPYAEDVRKFTFLSLYTNTSRPSEDQLNAMDKYIDAALLEDEEFQTESIPNPCNQYLYRCLSHRALNPGRVLPDVDVFIKKLFDTPERVTSGTREVLEEMLKSISLGRVKRCKQSDENNVHDFTALLEQGTNIDEAAQMLESTLLQFLRKGSCTNIIPCLKVYRDTCFDQISTNQVQ
ncbi:XRCC5 [Lepeophtheirus salmonis]|uniref:XRCC5 n=1 Tax=Lepeophtheirus salmonis TaxID=72036 RepID=A0A7R8D287_LEPSM|nr:XRCC5 [Lepeophtheirus salmonis]CAF3000647.1 XRCC5 [Lepeophtheirus salmonis]